ncbi:MAG: A24 family peptidase [SAR86 cluster bacterium]|jgi:leader peptidase (prepilin peptidase) / N-methyltransferase|uniref:Prepilin leader peptidase/N-methyltransferase n=1 Tax=SAR86 cluster bacterium TaxID=2030880 RepID=A0A972VWM7_9GAMM|nr:A24 family peptidase [Pseudomonadales bacterium]MDP4912062.1 A24 family peptidase [Pseudomonadales bacterium]NQV63730.1 prepilin peptidase [SAR86 cluster bacterium]|tara:strand:- start:72 stop:944 length:873 start_codon:yes stop_codon:yes gene_type:complete
MTDYLILLEAEFPLFILICSLILGLLVGSFLNVVIHRLPIMLQREWQQQANDILGNPEEAAAPAYNLVVPNSRCPRCEHNIRPWENIPLLSYALLRGKCSACQNPISARYPLVELLTGVLTLLVVYTFGVTLAGLAACCLTWALVALSLIDYDHQLLPDDITLPFLWLGLILNSFGLFTHLATAVWGAVAGYLVFWCIYQAFKLITGREGMGYGDFKLLAMLGAWMGWQSLPLIIILSSFAGALIGGTLILFGRDKAKPIPFGPYLAIAGWIALIWGDALTASYLQFVAI